MWGILLIIVAVIAVAVGVRFYMRNKDKDEAAGPAPAPVEPSEPPLPRGERLLLLLPGLQLKIQCDPDRDDAIVGKVSDMIDKLVDLVEPLNEGFEGGELTFVINRMVESYLPELINPYVDMSGGQKAGKKDEMLALLSELDEELEKARQAVAEGNDSAFSVQARFLKAKFEET